MINTHITSKSSFNTSFYSYFVFMQKKGEEDYVWALTMLYDILSIENYPSVIISNRELALMNDIRIVFLLVSNYV